MPHRLPHNPAAAVKLGGKRGSRKVRPLLLTAPRVERWRETGEIPAPVMIWTAAQCGQFLDSLTACQEPPREAERLYALFHLAAHSGMRRSELAGLAWAGADLEERRVHIRQAQVDDRLDSTKSEDSDRQVPLDPGTASVLSAWRKAQLAERLAWGPAWTDSGRVFTREDGTPLRPASTMLLAVGQPIKVISEILGHSTSAFTADVYTEVARNLPTLPRARPRHLSPEVIPGWREATMAERIMKRQAAPAVARGGGDKSSVRSITVLS